ncbi:hypothetical protein SynNOUM97013_02460 [Synechococcus sp. NOUM97013]|nr:hypothetical protein SynNOUM97013_02460 [Synechococcus sp. NOUM97013]
MTEETLEWMRSNAQGDRSRQCWAGKHRKEAALAAERDSNSMITAR